MDISDLLPHPTDSPESWSNTFFRVLLGLGVDEVTVRAGQIHLLKPEFADDFVDQIADVYLGRLRSDNSDYNRSILTRFNRTQIRESLHRYLVLDRLILDILPSDLVTDWLYPMNYTLCQAIFKLKVHEAGLRGNLIHLEGSEPEADFVDRLADVYLGLLAISETELDRTIRSRFDRATIRKNLGLLIRYKYTDHPRSLTLQ